MVLGYGGTHLGRRTQRYCRGVVRRHDCIRRGPCASPQPTPVFFGGGRVCPVKTLSHFRQIINSYIMI